MTYETDSLPISARQVKEYGNHLYVLAGSICKEELKECGTIFKMDLLGNILWKKEISTLDIGNSNSLQIRNDTITITGHRNTVDQPIGYFIQQMNLNGDIMVNFEFPIDTTLVKNAFNYGLIFHNQNWYLYGAGNGIDGSVDAILMKVNPEGELIQTKIWDDDFKEVQLADLYERTNGSLIMLAETVSFGEIDSKSRIIELNENLEREYLWNSPMAANLGVLNNFTSLQNNNLAILTPNTLLGLSSKAPFIYFVDEDNNEYARYEFDFQIGVDVRRFTSNLITAENGDIIGVGYYNGIQNNDTGYMYRISSEGELLWETTFRSQDWENNNQFRNVLNDVIELDEGSLIAVGWQDETIDNQSLRDLWVIRVSADGCLYKDECSFGQFTTSEEFKQPVGSEVVIFPNPNVGIFDIQFEGFNNSIFKFELSDINGLMLYEQQIQSNTSIDVKHVDTGIYICRIFDLNSNLIKTKKLIIKSN